MRFRLLYVLSRLIPPGTGEEIKASCVVCVVIPAYKALQTRFGKQSPGVWFKVTNQIFK